MKQHATTHTFESAPEFKLAEPKVETKQEEKKTEEIQKPEKAEAKPKRIFGGGGSVMDIDEETGKPRIKLTLASMIAKRINSRRKS